jgi:hypothetical protein
MAKSKTIRVTPNLMKCLEELRAAIKALPQGEKKRRAAGALDYLARTFKGKKQPLRGASCPLNTLIIGHG